MISNSGYAASNTRHRARQWTYDDAEVRAFAAAMVHVGYITTASGLQEYYEKPHGWTREHAWWEENDRTDETVLWDEAMDERFPT